MARIGLKAVELQSARIPAYQHFTRPWRRMAGCNVYLIGDAAAQVKVTTVGGLVTGLRGARAAALRRELSLPLLIRLVLNGFRSADYDRLLGLLNERAIHLLGRYNRDQAAGMLCRILLAQPRFLSFAPFMARGLWKNRTDVGFSRGARRTKSHKELRARKRHKFRHTAI